jgi:hypothetical protein
VFILLFLFDLLLIYLYFFKFIIEEPNTGEISEETDVGISNEEQTNEQSELAESNFNIIN